MLEWEKKVYDFVNSEKIFINLKKYVLLLKEKNKELNLTGFNDEKIWQDGIYQSIVILNKTIDENNENINLLDIGSGAGFPSIPYMIFKENKIKLSICEPIKKKCVFLNFVKENLNLSNLKIYNQRVENLEKEEEFNFVCARAVMKLNMLIEISSRIGKINCKYLFLKSKNVYNEIEESKKIIKDLSISNLKIININLEDQKEHNIVTYYKLVKTPKKYPRKWNEILKGNKLINEGK